jgi:hypothetical protein
MDLNNKFDIIVFDFKKNVFTRTLFFFWDSVLKITFG